MPLLSLRAVSVSYDDVSALRSTDLDIEAGEIRAVLGENGAGKSTLMNAIYGMVAAKGEFLWDGRRVAIDNPAEARNLGIGMVHQEFALVEALTVTENLALAVEDGTFVDYDRVRQTARRRADELGLDIGDVDLEVGELPVGSRQRIEILKALLTEVRLLILDEPTAVLTPSEIEQLFAVLRPLRDSGVAILLITHKLGEVMALADSVTVLRRGAVVAERSIADTSQDELARLMVGDMPPSQEVERPPARGTMMLELTAVSLRDKPGRARLDEISLEVAAGEIFGIAGVDGNGQQEVYEILTGHTAATAGTWRLAGDIVHGASVEAVSNHGVAVIPPERRRDGAVLDMAVWENAILDGQILALHTSKKGLDQNRAQTFAAELVDRYRIVCSSTEATADSLSGGNLQKLIVGRAMARRPKLLVAFNPTRGLDLGAARDVHQAIRGVTQWGGAVLLISTDLDEVLALSDRVGVLYRGQLTDGGSRPFARTDVGLLMGGIRPARDTPAPTLGTAGDG